MNLDNVNSIPDINIWIKNSNNNKTNTQITNPPTTYRGKSVVTI